MNKKVVFVMAIVLFLIAGIWWKLYEQEKIRNEEISSSGFIEEDSIQISTRMTSKILKVSIKKEDLVKKGDLLASLDCLEAQMNLAAVEAKKDAELQASLKRTEALEAEYQRALTLKEECHIKAPFDGLISTIFKHEGEIILPGQSLLELKDPSSLRLRFFIKNKDLDKSAIGTLWHFKTDVSPKEYQAHVSWVSSQASFTPRTIQTQSDRERLVYEVEALFEYSQELKEGMPVQLFWKK